MHSNWIQAIPTPEAYRINRVLYDIQHSRDEETKYFSGPAAYVSGVPDLTDRAAKALVANDIGQLFLLGANPYLLRAYCLQLRIPEQAYLDALRAIDGEVAHG